MVIDESAAVIVRHSARCFAVVFMSLGLVEQLAQPRFVVAPHVRDVDPRVQAEPRRDRVAGGVEHVPPTLVAPLRSVVADRHSGDDSELPVRRLQPVLAADVRRPCGRLVLLRQLERGVPTSRQADVVGFPQCSLHGLISFASDAAASRSTFSGAIDTLAKLMDLQERWEKTQARKAFDAAVAAAKAQIPVIGKNATGHNSKRYADFSAYARVVDPILGAHGLGYRFRTVQDDKSIRTTCILFHKDGHSEENTLVGPADASGSKNAIQAIGSTLTYLQRYSLVQALGLAAAEDDDGRAGSVGAVVSAEQAKALSDLIDTKIVGTEARLLRWARVEKIEDIPAARYDEAMEKLQSVKAS